LIQPIGQLDEFAIRALARSQPFATVLDQMLEGKHQALVQRELYAEWGTIT
jgi:hypothetical protein